MKMIAVVALALVAVAAAAPVDVEPIPIIRSDFQQQPDGAFQSSFETGNGIKEEQTGELKQVVDEENKPVIVLVLRGSYSYPRPDGTEELVKYIADETGYHAEGPSIPVGPARR